MAARPTSVAQAYSRRVQGAFERLVDRSGDCWIWLGARDPKGYGRFTISADEALALGIGSTRLSAKAHRVALALDGRPPGDLLGLHNCDNPPCVKPAHLYVGTPADNRRDCVDRGRVHRMSGEANPSSRLTDEQRGEIRALRASGETLRALAAAYGVSHPAIRKICR